MLLFLLMISLGGWCAVHVQSQREPMCQLATNVNAPRKLVNFTTTQCPTTSCFGECLMPQVALSPGNNAYAECKETSPSFSSVEKILYYPPGQDHCIEFVSETDIWYHFDERYHFRKSKARGVVEILITNIRLEDNLTMIVCATQNLLPDAMNPCVNRSRSTLIVTSEVAEMPSMAETTEYMTKTDAYATTMMTDSEVPSMVETTKRTERDGDCEENQGAKIGSGVLAGIIIIITLSMALAVILGFLCSPIKCCQWKIKMEIYKEHK